MVKIFKGWWGIHYILVINPDDLGNTIHRKAQEHIIHIDNKHLRVFIIGLFRLVEPISKVEYGQNLASEVNKPFYERRCVGHLEYFLRLNYLEYLVYAYTKVLICN